MRGQEFRAGDKKVRKMSRHGLVERNLARGTEQRISSRPEEISFARDRPGLEGMADKPGTGYPRKKKYRKMAGMPALPGGTGQGGTGLQGYLPGKEEEAGRFDDTAVPAAWGGGNAPANMRGAGDKPKEDTPDNKGCSLPEDGEKRAGQGGTPARGEARDMGQRKEMPAGTDGGKNISAGMGRGHPEFEERKAGRTGGEKRARGERRDEGKREQAFAPVPGSTEKEPELEVHMDGREPVTASGHGRLKYEKGQCRELAGKRLAGIEGQAEIKRKMEGFFANGAKTGSEPAADRDGKEKPVTAAGHGRLKFEAGLSGNPPGRKGCAGRGGKPAVDHGVGGKKAVPGFGMKVDRGKEPVVSEGRGRLKFEAGLYGGMLTKGNRGTGKRRQVTETISGGTEPERKQDGSLAEGTAVRAVRPGTGTQGRTQYLYFGADISRQGKCAAGRGDEPVFSGETGEEPADGDRQQKKRKEAQRKVEKAEDRLEKARGKNPAEKRKPLLPGRVINVAGQETVRKVHRKIRESEHDNTGLEAAHKAELAAECGAGISVRLQRMGIYEKPYRELHRARMGLAKSSAGLEYRKLLKEHPELQKKYYAKWLQKRKLQRKYAAAVREAEKGARHSRNVLDAAGQAVRAMAGTVTAKRSVAGIVAAGVLAVSVCGSLLSSCSAMLTGIQSAVISTCYVAEDAEINASELMYTELETDLQVAVNDTETAYPGYDEYRYSVGEIGHNPYELVGYLSAVYDDFTYAQVEAELLRLFGLQYQLVREEIVETRTYTDKEGEEQEYEWHVLRTTLSVQPLSDIIAGSLAGGSASDRYGVYMQTCGNRQCYGNPFGFAWIGYVTSPYGYRVHPDTGGKDLHRGVDIGVAEGTPVKAVQDGTVVSAGNAGDYGLCVVVEGEDGYRSVYAHCSSLSVGAGQMVKRGDVIAAVGSTGNSTGPHLHLEVAHDGEYLDPYFYVDNGGSGYLPGGGAAGKPDFSGDPGGAMGDGSFGAMLEEAEKYLGYPYVWGGSSPSTSFDCSGYVSWVVNHSGVGDVGRQTAQGLYNLCTPVGRAGMQPGDLVFFTGTYSTANPVTHVGIYVGEGRMIHCGSPVSYANIDSSYWSAHFYCGGRLP